MFPTRLTSAAVPVIFTGPSSPRFAILLAHAQIALLALPPIMLCTAAMFHPGVVFATLVVQFATTYGSPVSAPNSRRDTLFVDVGEMYPRHGGEGCEEDGEHCSSSTSPPAPTSGTSNSTSQPNTTTGSSTLSPPSSSTPTFTSQTATQTMAESRSSNMSISTGGIIGTAFGAFVLVVATLVVCGLLYRRWRRSRNHPQGSRPPIYQADAPPAFGAPFPPTEMSQTQSSPLVALAVASMMTTTPPRHYPTSTSTTGSMSPLITAVSLGHSLSITSSSNRRTSLSYTDGDSGHEPLHPTRELHSPLSASEHAGLAGGNFSGRLAGIILESSTPASPTTEPSNLVRAMTAYQKSLEAEDRKSNQSGGSTSDITKQEEQDVTDSHDPPPEYDA